MDAEDPLLFYIRLVLLVKPKGMVHTTAGYMVYTAYTFKMFSTIRTMIFFCTADIGWITGHSYILYGPLLNGATTVIFEGVPSYPDYSRFGKLLKSTKLPNFIRRQPRSELWQKKA
jgi:acetyl-CoA synthetase